MRVEERNPQYINGRGFPKLTHATAQNNFLSCTERNFGYGSDGIGLVGGELCLLFIIQI